MSQVPETTTIPVPSAVLQQISNYLLSCPASDVFEMVAALKELERKLQTERARNEVQSSTAKVIQIDEKEFKEAVIKSKKAKHA